MREKKAFTLIEIMVGILIISAVLVAGFASYVKIGYGKISLIEQTEMQKNSLFFSERLFQIIKEGGMIDYEEYFNRKILGTSIEYGHYSTPTGFGNFGLGGKLGDLVNKSNVYGNGYYYCRSGNGISLKMQKTVGGKIVSDGCYGNANLNSPNNTPQTKGHNYLTEPNPHQRYGQYSFQFVDYNSNYNNDFGDEDGNGNIIGDDDDEYVGTGPSVFEPGNNVVELYLLSGDKRKRTFIRWNWYPDPDAPSDLQNTCTKNNFTEGCLGTVEFLRLEGKDWGLDHLDGTGDATEYDGVIDTWIIEKQFVDQAEGTIQAHPIVAGTEDMEKFWTPLFATSVNVTDFKIMVYPNIDYNHSWKDKAANANISPYVIVNYKIKPSWEIRKRLNNTGKTININTTVNLTDIFSK